MSKAKESEIQATEDLSSAAPKATPLITANYKPVAAKKTKADTESALFQVLLILSIFSTISAWATH
jgi:hypothetical protein